jgi:hypothetical protein
VATGSLLGLGAYAGIDPVSYGRMCNDMPRGRGLIMSDGIDPREEDT